MSERIRVLVVDDSALMRKLIPAILAREASIEVVGTAMDGAFALKKIEELKPDVVTLDLEMPRMDGMTFLEKLMSQNPVPVVVCSGLTGPRTEAAIRALEIGAVDIITKPKIGIRGFLEESAVLLEDTVRRIRQRKKLVKHAAADSSGFDAHSRQSLLHLASRQSRGG